MRILKGAGSDLISISTEIGGFSDESKWATTIADGTAYYVFCRDSQGMVLINQKTAAITLAPRSSVSASDNGQWIFEKAATTDSDYRLKNKATGLYLTISNGKLLQTTLDNTQSQVWYCGDWYGSKWRLVNRGTSQYLGLLSGDGITEDADFKGAGSDLISISNEIGGFSDESKCATTIADGTAYYVFWP